MSLIYSDDMKKNNMKYYNISFKNDIYLLYIKINNMKILLKITANVAILSSKMTFLKKINDIKHIIMIYEL